MGPLVHWPVGMGVGVRERVDEAGVSVGVGIGVVGIDEETRDMDRVEGVTTLEAEMLVSVIGEIEEDAWAEAEELDAALEVRLLLAGAPSQPRKNELNRVEKGPDCETELKRVQSAAPASAFSAAYCTATQDESAVQAATHSSADISRIRLMTVEPDW
jgi:hypothetical protein